MDTRARFLGLTAVSLLLVALLGRPAGPHALPFPAKEAGVWTVCRAGPPACDYTSVQAAVDAAAPGDVVKVAAGLYPEVNNRGGHLQTLYLTKTLFLRGGYTTTNGFAEPPDPVAHPTILNPQGLGRVVYVAGEITPTLFGLRLAGGNSGGIGGGDGGGVYVMTATVVISRCVIVGNSAGRGGGLYLNNSDATLIASAVLSNTAQYLGGGLYAAAGNTTLTGNTIAGNQAATGAGMYLASDLAVLTANTVAGNHAQFDGGGVHLEVYGGRTYLEGNTIAGNTAGWSGAGLYYGESVRGEKARSGQAGKGAPHPGIAPVLSGNIIRDNHAQLNGGGVYLSGDGGTPTLSGNTIQDNTALGRGGGVYLDWSSDPTTISDNTIVGNEAQGQGGGIYLGTTTATVRDNTVQGNRSQAEGGGIYGRGTLIGNTLYSNTASLDGGGAACPGGILDGNRVLANRARDGGGLYLGEVRLTNNLIAENQAARHGSGLYVTGASRMRHTTLVANGGGEGSGICFPSSGSQATLALTNTILFSHTVGITVAAGNTALLEATLWGNVADWAGGGAILTGTVNVWGNPAFADPSGGDYHLGPGSAAIDQGVDAGVTADLDGDPRPAGHGYELGADEFPDYILQADLSCPYVLNPAQTFTSTLAVSSTGLFTCTHVLLTATLPIQQQALTATADRGTCAVRPGWGAGAACDLMALPPGTVVHITLTAQTTSTLPPTWPVAMPTTATLTAVETASQAHADSYLQNCHVRLNDDPTEYVTVQEAVDRSAAPTDMVKVAGYCAGVQERGGARQQLYLSRTLTVQGGYTTTNWTEPQPWLYPTTLDALGQGRAVYIAGNAPTLAGLRLLRGNAAGLGGYTDPGGQGYDAGGGGYLSGSDATISACAILSSTALYGGGLFMDAGAPTLVNNTIAGNSAECGGGLYLFQSPAVLTGNTLFSNTAAYLGGGASLEDSPAAWTDNTITANRSSSGAGLHLHTSAATLTGNAIASNQASGAGGGLYLEGSPALLKGDTLATNTANYGGGLYLFQSPALLSGNTIVANQAGRSGGGLWLGGSDAVLTNDVIADNRAGTTGGGLYLQGSAPRLRHTTLARNGDSALYAAGGSAAILTNTIVVSHTVGVLAAGGASVRLEATLWGSGVWGNGSDWAGSGTVITGTVNLWGNPDFSAAGDYHLGPASAARDAGLDAGVREDLDGDPRPIGKGYDLGADERRIFIYLPLVVRGG